MRGDVSGGGFRKRGCGVHVLFSEMLPPHPQDVCIAPLTAELLFPLPAHRVSPALCLPSLAPSILLFFPPTQLGFFHSVSYWF